MAHALLITSPMAINGTCPACDSFLPTQARECPNCSSTRTSSVVGKWARRALGLAGGTSLAVTLMACYGVPCAGTECVDSFPCNDGLADLDHDGFCGSFDCDETDPNRHSGAVDPSGDGIDQNCDGSGGDPLRDASVPADASTHD